jgi:hypothetical protein
MADAVKITGTIKTDANYNTHQGVVNLRVDLSLRDLFAAFALMGVIGLNLDESTHESDAMYAYHAADAMLAARKEQPQ